MGPMELLTHISSLPSYTSDEQTALPSRLDSNDQAKLIKC